MKICGIELKANNTILTVCDVKDKNEIGDDIVDYIDLKIKKIVLEDDENQKNIQKYNQEVSSFINENNIEKIIIKKRAKKGNFSGGAVTFKMEAILQLNTYCDVELISGQAISSYERKNEINLPCNLKKYQEQAFLAIITSLKK